MGTIWVVLLRRYVQLTLSQSEGVAGSQSRGGGEMVNRDLVVIG